jgi:hypothetical protein
VSPAALPRLPRRCNRLWQFNRLEGLSKLGQDAIEAMHFKEAGRLAVKAGKADIPAGFEQFPPKEHDPREGRSAGLATIAQIEDDGLSSAGRGLLCQPACLGMGEAFGGVEDN